MVASYVPASLRDFIGNGRVIDTLRRAVAQDRLPHALIFSGPEGVGKCTLAVLLAQLLNCTASGTDRPCGACRECVKIRAVLESRGLECLAPHDKQNCGACANCRILVNRHPDVIVVRPEKTIITIEQVRDLIGEVSYQPFQGRYRVVVLDPADEMRADSQNCLLKTLEEPPSRTFIILITANPYLLLTTIRSRSRILNFAGIPEGRIEEHLVRAAGRAPEDARLAAALSRGSLGAALEFDAEGYRDIRREALRFTELLLGNSSFAEASRLVAALVKEKAKEAFPVWLVTVESLLHDVYFAHVEPGRMTQRDVAGTLEALARSCPREQVVRAIRMVKKVRVDLARNISRQIAVESLFLTNAPWHADSRRS